MLPVFVLLFASMLWGLTWWPLKHFGQYGLAGPLITLTAHGSVGVLSLPYLALKRREWAPAWRSMLVLAVCGGLANLAFATAMVSGDVTRVMVLFYLLPAWGVLLARVFLAELIDAKRAFSLVFALAGAFLVLGGFRVFAAPPSWVDAVAALSGLALAANNVAFRQAQRIAIPSKIAAVFVGSLVWAGGVLLLAPSAERVTAPASVWMQAVAFGLVWILLATAGTLYGVHRLEAGRSSVLIIMELVTAVVSSAIVLGQLPDAMACAGGVLILASALLEAIRPEPVPLGATR